MFDFERISQAITDRLEALPEVEYSTAVPVICITTSLKNVTPEVRKKIYELEAELMNQFPNIGFDFITVKSESFG